MKSYTDLEQSKKLAEFLPIESADMAYYFWENSGNIVTPCPFILDGTEVKEGGMFTYLNCWSLAALYNILPLPCEIHKQAGDDSIYYYVEYTDKDKYLYTERHKNSVDACVAMIEKLHELKML